MCQITSVDGEDHLAGDDTAVATRKARVIRVLTAAGIRPSTLTGFALLDTAVTVLALRDIPPDAIFERVRQRLTEADALKAALAYPQTPVHSH